MGSKPPPLHPPPCGFPERCRRKRWENTGESLGHCQRAPRPHRPPSAGTTLLRMLLPVFRDRVPDFVHLELPRTASWRPPHVAALSAWRAPLTPALREAGPSVQSGERTPGPTREGVGGGSGAAGAATAFPRSWETASPLRGLERGGRTRPRSLEASPKPRIWVPPQAPRGRERVRRTWL